LRLHAADAAKTEPAKPSIESQKLSLIANHLPFRLIGEWIGNARWHTFAGPLRRFEGRHDWAGDYDFNGANPRGAHLRRECALGAHGLIFAIDANARAIGARSTRNQ
jgi:hypothetical protein